MFSAIIFQITSAIWKLSSQHWSSAAYTLHSYSAKCHFAQAQVEFLGHLVTATGIAPLTLHVQPILAFPVPTYVKSLQTFLGMLNFYFAVFCQALAKLSSHSLMPLPGQVPCPAGHSVVTLTTHFLHAQYISHITTKHSIHRMAWWNVFTAVSKTLPGTLFLA